MELLFLSTNLQKRGSPSRKGNELLLKILERGEKESASSQSTIHIQSPVVRRGGREAKERQPLILPLRGKEEGEKKKKGFGVNYYSNSEWEER